MPRMGNGGKLHYAYNKCLFMIRLICMYTAISYLAIMTCKKITYFGAYFVNCSKKVSDFFLQK